MSSSTAFIVLFVLVAWNIWTTRRVVQLKFPDHQRAVIIIMIWLVPVLGGLFSFLDPAGRRRAPPPRIAAPPERESAPQELARPGMPSFAIGEHLFDGQGFPILDWKQLAAWSASAPDAGQRAAAVELGRRAWLLLMQETLGPHAHVLETDDAWVLSSYEPKVAQAAARFMTTARQRIAKLLDGVAHFPAGTRSILVVLDSQEQYYRYITNYYPDEGEFAFSSGMFVDPGCPHFVTVTDDLTNIEPVIAHEMTHSALAYLELPRWLDEGIAVSTEHRVSASHRHVSQQLETMSRHLEFWNTERMQEFWSGESFHRTDDGNALSYDLAQGIVALLGREWTSFTRFVLGAKRDDAGAAAARAALNLDLGELAAATLRFPARKDWSPNPSAWRHAD